MPESGISVHIVHVVYGVDCSQVEVATFKK